MNHYSLVCCDLKSDLNMYKNYAMLINIELASSNLPKHVKRLNYVIIVGWNDRIKSSHKDARN